MTVGELWEPNLGWRFEDFADYLPESVLGEIAAHEVIDDEEAVDSVYWNGSPTGGFTLKSAIEIIKNEEAPSIEEIKGWRLIWRVQVPQRMRFFVWLAVQERLMTNANRFLRTLTDDPRCLVCGEVEETIEHIVRFCPAAKLVWRKLNIQQQLVQNSLPWKEWVLENIDEQNGSIGEEWPRFFVIICWWLWRWRNERCFNDRPDNPIDQASFLYTRLGMIREAMDRDKGVQGAAIRSKKEVYIRWARPKVGWVKLNTDGAAKGNPGRAGAGGVIRGCDGELFELFAMNCGVCTCTKAELMAVLRGEVVVCLLVGVTPNNSPYFHIIRRGKALIHRRGWEVSIFHCYREANRVADWLANYGVSSSDKLVLFEAVPLDLRAVLLEELSGVAWAHQVNSVL